MKRTYKFSLIALMATALLTGCATKPSNNLTFNPQSPTATAHFNTQNQKAIVNVITKDARQQPQISAYNINGNLHKLFSTPSVEQLFQQVIQQDLNAKGFRLESAGANVQVFVNVNEFYAKVEEGNIRHKITSKIQLQIQVQSTKGNFTKNLGSSRVDEGALGVNNEDIRKSLDAVLKDVVASLYNDNEITNAIGQLAN